MGWHLLRGHGESVTSNGSPVSPPRGSAQPRGRLRVGQAALGGVSPRSGGDSRCGTGTVLGSRGLSTGGDSLAFSDKNSRSFKVGLS